MNEQEEEDDDVDDNDHDDYDDYDDYDDHNSDGDGDYDDYDLKIMMIYFTAYRIIINFVLRIIKVNSSSSMCHRRNIDYTRRRT